jgi:hypothetical protein
MIAPASGPYTPVVHLSYPAYGKVLDRVLSRISLELHCDLSIFTAAIRAVYSSLVIDPSARSCYQSLIVANPFSCYRKHLTLDSFELLSFASSAVQ